MCFTLKFEWKLTLYKTVGCSIFDPARFCKRNKNFDKGNDYDYFFFDPFKAENWQIATGSYLD